MCHFVPSSSVVICTIFCSLCLCPKPEHFAPRSQLRAFGPQFPTGSTFGPHFAQNYYNTYDKAEIFITVYSPRRTCVFSCAANPRCMFLKRNLRFSGTFFSFLKGFTVVFHRKKAFSFLFKLRFFPQRIYSIFST
jgi:hypothetical protein